MSRPGCASCSSPPPTTGRARAGRATDGQRRFCDPTVEAFLERVDSLRAWASAHPRVSVGVAAHSIRAVPASWLEAIADYADRHRLVRHVHAHEQPREIAECEAEYGMTPIALLERTGFLGPRTTLVHGVHVTNADIEQLAESDTIVASCPTTEGSLGDGYFPALRYRDAGVRMAIGSDSQVIVDPFEETRELETLARRERHTRDALLARGDLWAGWSGRLRESRDRRRRRRRDRPRSSAFAGSSGRRCALRRGHLRLGRCGI